MTEKNKFEKGSSNLSNKKTKKGNSWKHQMYELEIAIAKESNNKKRDELIKIHNGYMNEYEFKETNHLVSRFGNLFPTCTSSFWLFYLE